MCALLLHKSMDLRKLIVAGTKCFPSRARARSQIEAGSTKRFEHFPAVLRVWLSGANLWCTALLSLEEPAPLSQRPGCGAESNGNTAEDSVRPGYSTWWGSQTRGMAQQLLGSLARWRCSFLDSGHTEKVWSRCLCLSSNQYPPHVSTTQPFFPNSHWPYLEPQPAVALVRAKKEVLELQSLAHAAHRAMVAP